ncbi:MAG: PTS lactose/cellobiose transporter subunit IIA [Paenibacillus macerans]|uniref:PTS lactose/cellobiose transporter subunit IIA n=1 Tax=Paenibacillus macerans TaxID=44252 RepID=A0A090ZIE5_PAEMA|nr:PTS lactose/cellobiose transporter subunit IIA [Paenibacillus macerans]KFN10010.1 PTS system, Lactose/Cellobiose specific IIA subunit [Paenibacillus macerans]MCY7558669.1 PTS lactose/cellobiose transporter subunit IIA [Paenibacillus macerans]MDU7474786.1 PTS lactose/cellobiose transporter subunit IIA [Paenibacillus macerans]MEC0140252.1 PTS lactose/cellobiose transporter subunit IIA [Paenibacillus macerans]MEC0154222.1 PTS lactose/cellobiose transporter subunit IIA [Paenibacillus macerans]
MDEYQEIIMEIITNAGVAKSKAMEAIRLAQRGQAEQAAECLNEGKAELVKAHKAQTRLIQSEADGTSHEVTLLMVHAQDHLMSAITIRDLAEHIVDLYNKLDRR